VIFLQHRAVWGEGAGARDQNGRMEKERSLTRRLDVYRDVSTPGEFTGKADQSKRRQGKANVLLVGRVGAPLTIITPKAIKEF